MLIVKIIDIYNAGLARTMESGLSPILIICTLLRIESSSVLYYVGRPA